MNTVAPASGIEPDGHGPTWAAAVAQVAERVAAAFALGGRAGCLTVIDLEPWRVLDAWWLRASLEPLARLSGRPVRYVPCNGPAAPPAAAGARAQAWSAGAAHVEISWTNDGAAPCTPDDAPWVPDGPVLVLAGATAQRLGQPVLLAHHGKVQWWAGEKDAECWHALEEAGLEPWVAASAEAYAKGVPSGMFSLPLRHLAFLHRLFAWAVHGCVVLDRAPGWSNHAQIREHAAEGAAVDSGSPPVNFHWLAQHLPRLGATVHAVRDARTDTVQASAVGLGDAAHLLPLVCAPLRPLTLESRAARTRAVLALAEHDFPAAVSQLHLSAHDPALLRGAWEKLAAAAPQARAEDAAQLAAWVERVATDNPWTPQDAGLLRAAGHVTLACARPDLAAKALCALDESRRANAADLAALAECAERVGNLEAALAHCARSLWIAKFQPVALAVRERVQARIGSMHAPWRMPHALPDSPIFLDPLHADHAPALVRQMRDASIAAMTALPALDPADDGRAWIAARIQDEGSATFAIVHRQLGFAGYLDLRISGRSAFLCYWIGTDFQGRGLCAKAIAAALDLARREGIDVVLSSAYEDNARSLQALERSGFRRIGIRAQAPDNDRVFVAACAPDAGEEETVRRLIEFCEATNSGLKFGLAQAAHEGDTHETH